MKPPGIEPRPTESKSAMLPLHHDLVYNPTDFLDICLFDLTRLTSIKKP